MRGTVAALLAVLVLLGLGSAGIAQDQDRTSLKVHRNVVYGMHGGLALLLDVYEPTESNGHALLFIAGSGWHWPPHYGAGAIKDVVASGVLGGGGHEVFADEGFTVFVVNHRQAPLFRYPAAVDDARRAVRFIRHHGHEYGVSEDTIAAYGISSGAHLVLMLALSDSPGNPESADEVEHQSAKVDVVAAFAAPTDLSAEDWTGAIGSVHLASFVGAPHHGFAGGAHAEASPISYVDRDDPPVLLMHGDADVVVPVEQSRTLAARIREHEAEVEYVEIPGGGHDFEKVLNTQDPNELPAFPAVARWLRENLASAERGAEARRTDRFFDSGGVQIRYIDVGPRDGEPIVLVHGFTHDIETCWGNTGAIAALEDEFRVIALDCRGHGKSDKPHDPDAYGLELATDVVRLLDHLQIEKAHIAGYSMGGGVTYTLMVHHPERVISAMPCGTGLKPPDVERQGFIDALQAALDHMASDADPSNAKWPIEGAAQQFAELVRKGADPVALAAVYRSLRHIIPDVSDLERNGVPALSLFGELDHVSDIEWTAERVPNLDFELIKNAGHVTVFQRPEFIAAIKAFLARHRDTGK